MAEEITEDLIYGGRVRIRQPARGYRVNVDTILLAASFPAAGHSGRVIELGCGVGAALLVVARNHASREENTFVGLERNPTFAQLARENVVANGLADRVEIVEADALDPPEALGNFNHVFFNPPYDYPGEGREPSDARKPAHIADRPLADLVKVWCNRMPYYASLTLIQRPQRLGEILDALEGRLGGVEIFPIRPHAAAPARRIIVRARKGVRKPLRLLPGLNMHPDDQSKAKYTPEAEAILRGEAPLWIG